MAKNRNNQPKNSKSKGVVNATKNTQASDEATTSSNCSKNKTSER